jgi:hypothetical protein
MIFYSNTDLSAICNHRFPIFSKKDEIFSFRAKKRAASHSKCGFAFLHARADAQCGGYGGDDAHDDLQNQFPSFFVHFSK